MSEWIDGFFQEASPGESYRTSHEPEKSYEISVENTWFIIDWDDTLLPTTRLAHQGINLDTPMLTSEQQDELEAVDAAASGLLRKIANFYGKVLIITNAQPGWIELSSKKFLPETHELIFAPSNSSTYSFSSSSSGFNVDNDENTLLNLPNFSMDFLESTKAQKKSFRNGRKRARIASEMQVDPTSQNRTDETGISIFSARAMYERQFENPALWKLHAFKKILAVRIPNLFLAPLANPLKKTHSEESIATLSKHSASGLSSIDLTALIEEEGSYEVEMDFNENDSFFSFNFQPSDCEDFNDFSEKKPEECEVNEVKENIPKVQACNLISIGDCLHDCESLQNLELNLKDTLKKTVRFRGFPTVSLLIRELHELGDNLNNIVKATRDVHLIVSDRS